MQSSGPPTNESNSRDEAHLYFTIPQELRTFPHLNIFQDAPPTYEECLGLDVPPPSYVSIFGQTLDIKKSSQSSTFIKNIFLLLFGTAGCALMASVTVVVPVLMVIVGGMKLDECPAQKLLPVYLLVGGSFGIVRNLVLVTSRFQAALTAEEERALPWHRRLHFLSFLNFFLTAWFITGCVWVYTIYEPDYVDTESKFFCNYTLYMFAFWLVTLVLSAAGLLIAVITCITAAALICRCNHSTESTFSNAAVA